ncbi:MAG TPA: response regulator [Polyangiaceae bacterium]|nr:response regulator [Polyangiaceae bacterium]
MMSKAPAAPARDPGGRASVLVVDDVAANLVAAEALLDGLGCEVVKASSGENALRLLLKREFAVMLLDVQMPEMDGYEVARHVRMNSATRDIPIIFLTATHNSPDNVLQGYGSGAVDFLFKPLNPDVLRSKVRIFLELYAGRRQLADANLQLEQKHAELRAAYDDLQATQAQLVQSAKMASLGELVAGVAHEINNPLAFVLSHLDTIKRSQAQFLQAIAQPLPETAHQHWTRAQSRLDEAGIGLERIRDLVVKLRTFSRLDEGERKLVSIRECLDSVLTILQHRTGDRIQVEVSVGEPELLDCYPALLNQVLLNLVANAIDAIEGPGKITIAAGQQAGSYVISIADTGPGIPRELRERILEPFFTTKPVGQGTGLGLSIAYSIVQKHRGSLVLGDAVGGGALATIRLPLGADDPARG